MKRLLTLEYYKNLTYRPFQIFTVLYFLCLGLLLFIGLVNIDLGGLQLNLKSQEIYNFPQIWNFTTWIVALLKIFPGLIIVFSICQEFTNRMFKQNVIDGLGKNEFVYSKILTILAFSIISTLIVFAITFALGMAYSEEKGALITQEMYFILNYFVKLVAFFSFLMFLSVLLRKSIFVFLVFFFWWIGEAIISGFEKYYMNIGEVVPASLEVVKKTYVTDFLPLSSMSNLIPNPLFRLEMAQMIGKAAAPEFPLYALIAAVIWTLVFCFGSYYILKKRDC